MDETENFRKTGILTMMGSSDFTKRRFLGKERYWIRIQDIHNSYYRHPIRLQRLLGIYMNSTPIDAVETRMPELFVITPGSEAVQCRLREGRICRITVWVNEIRTIHQDELAQIEKEHEVRYDLSADGKPEAIWIEWKEVPGFDGTGPNERCYRVDKIEGIVTFPDGRNGRMPAWGPEPTVRIEYSVGGGSAGNLPAHAIRGMSRSIGFISDVDNHEMTVGGCDQEQMQEALKRSSAALRHGYRAVTVRDYEDLALEADRSVCRAKCFSGRNESGDREYGQVTLVVLQKDFENGRKYFDEVRARIMNDMKERIPPQLTKRNAFHIIEPNYLELSVSVTLQVAEYSQVFDVRSGVKKRLEQFLNPVTGNYSGAGWEIGSIPNTAQILNALKEDDVLRFYNQNQELIRSYEADLARYTVSAAMDPDNGTIYYSTYAGQVYRILEGGEQAVLYDSEDSEELSVPHEISLGPDQNLYVADIGLRDVLRIRPDGVVERIEEDLDLYDKEIAYNLNADYGLIVCTDYSVKEYQDGSYTYITLCKMSETQSILCILMWAAVVILAVGAAVAVFLLIRYVVVSGSKFHKIAAGMIVGAVGMAALFAGILIPRYQELILDAIITRAQMASEIMVENLPYDAFSRIDSASDFMDEDYQAVRNAAHDVFMARDATVEDLYCAFYKIQDGMIIATYCLQEDTGAIHPQDWPYEGSDEQEIIESRQGKVYLDYQTSEGSFLFVLNPVIDDTGEVIGLLEVGTDLKSFQSENQAMILDLFINIVAVTIVVILIALELIIFVQAKGDYDKERAILDRRESGIPIPAEVMAALPISAEVVVGALFSVFGSAVLERIGEKRSVIFSAILFTAGFALRIVPNIWILTIGNGIVGAGWGMLLLIINAMIAMKPEEEKDKGFAAYNAAVQNGVNCGVVFGSFLINWFSYQGIFAIVAGISLVVYFMSMKYLTQYRAAGSQKESDDTGSGMSIFRFLFKGRVLVYFAMICVPMIAGGYFLIYTFPILAAEYGMPETYTGYSYLLNGLCIMALSNVLTNLFSKKGRKRGALVLAALIYGGAFVLVAIYQNLPALLAAIILLGLSDSFGLPLQTGHYTDLPEVKAFGYERAIGVYSLFENGAQAAGSFIFSYVLVIGVREGLFLVTGILLVLAFLFFLLDSALARKQKQKKSEIVT